MWKFLTNNRAKGTRTISPNGLYVAITGSLHEIWGNYTAPLALWTTSTPHQLLYHRKNYVAHALNQSDKPNFLYWSDCGKWATFYEFKRQETYQIVFISLLEGVAYRVPASDSLLQRLGKISLNDTSILTFLRQHEYLKPTIHVDQVSLIELQP